jgi:preprotein translocase subunit Sec61beta
VRKRRHGTTKGEKMPSIVFQIAALVIGLLIVAAYFASPVKLKKGLVISIGAAVAAAVLLTAIRNFGFLDVEYGRPSWRPPFILNLGFWHL